MRGEGVVVSEQSLALLSTETEEAMARRIHRNGSPHPALWGLLDAVVDPEIPALSIWDIGILQDVSVDSGQVAVVLTPTYSGCPAMQDIAATVQRVLNEAGYSEVRVETRLMPSWTTDWLTAGARSRLREEGISPPSANEHFDTAACPQCGSHHVAMISQHSGTACRAMYRCMSCHEVFDHFKAIR